MSHPNVATAHTIEEHDGEMFIVVEYIGGPELREIIAENPPEAQSLRGIVDIANPIAFGLQPARKKESSRAPLSRPISWFRQKPARGTDGEVKIMEFVQRQDNR